MEFNIPTNLIGLSDAEVAIARKTHGFNQIKTVEKNAFVTWLTELVKEPMLLLLIAVAVIYLVVGEYGEFVFMLAAILVVSGISFYQDFQTQKALKELEKLNEPLSIVIRNRKPLKIPTRELAVGDLCVIEEGKMINADGRIIHSNDFSVNEASLTGETYSVFKSADTEDNNVYSGTIVVSGLAVFQIENIGATTKIGKIGGSLDQIEEENSPLRIQITDFVKKMAVFGVVIFIMVCIYRFVQTKSILESLLNGLTIAMSVLPEEIPVAFSTFMALGAWKMMQKKIIVKRSSVIETLGSTTVICTDKTGTITANIMQLKNLYLHKTSRVYDTHDFEKPELSELIEYAMWSSEPVPFDPMEKTLHQVYQKTQRTDSRTFFHMIHEYPLEGKPPMMTHVFENGKGERIIAAKGAPEAIIKVCTLHENEQQHLHNTIKEFGSKGYRVLGVAKSNFTRNDFPEKQQDFEFEFLGFTVFYDPPKEGINQVFNQIYQAGISVKVITGDNPDTTWAVAQQSGIKIKNRTIEGKDLVHASDGELESISLQTTLFTRMFPEAKLAVVKALKRKGEIVAMLGDGVNDAPALKAAHIGVAMGSKGTEIAKAAADLIITNDNLDQLVVGIAEGRRIYTNIKKAIQYIISIHIPIILTVALPLFFGWIYPQIFTPIHVIFLELVMGPTCSIVYENEPMEKNTMQVKPRIITNTFLNWKEINISIVQGLIITLGILYIYQVSVQAGANEELTRSMVFSTLLFSNVFLSFANRSFRFSVFETLKYKNNLLWGITVIVIMALLAILYIPFVSSFFQVAALNSFQLSMSVGVAFVSVFWFEGFKWVKRNWTGKANGKEDGN